MLRAQGYAVRVSDGPARECDTFTCRHCQRIVFVKPKADPASVGGLCKSCMGLICQACVTRATCTPWERQMEIMESRDRLHRHARAG